MLSLLLVPEYEGSGELHKEIQKYVKKNGESFDLEQLKKEVNKSRKQKINDVQNLYAQLGLELKLPDEDILSDDNNILYKHTFMERSCLPIIMMIKKCPLDVMYLVAKIRKMLEICKEVDIFACNAI